MWLLEKYVPFWLLQVADFNNIKIDSDWTFKIIIMNPTSLAQRIAEGCGVHKNFDFFFIFFQIG